MNISSHLNLTLDDPATYYHQKFVTRPPNFEYREKSMQCRKKIISHLKIVVCNYPFITFPKNSFN